MLSPEQRAAFSAKLDASESADESTETSTVQTQEQQETPPASTTVSGQSNERAPVPFTRFAKVNSRMTAAEARAAKAEQELAELRSKFDGGSDKPVKSYLDELIEQEASASGKSTANDELVSRLTDLERAHAATLLDKTLLQAQKDYPDLPEDILLAAIGAKLSVEDAVTIWDDMKQKVLKNHAPAQVRQAPATPPIPGKVPPMGSPRPRTLEEAHVAFRRHLQGQA
ncbi:hypothetical protein UFOVP777_4 [uncultured Caudovirales phage]|uniref:Uncharacterized protein n=1 Tax=uncultured Caudovirales phage TaxID=2100421 RepID=A0A6J5NX27_9CAUD|nr:hypothetical protein UFOVP777_4 [uncultured Caudovirales phage]